MIADSADIKFACPQCGQRIVVDKSAAGLNGACPICEGPVVVPHVSMAEEYARHPDTELAGHSRSAFTDPGLDETREELFASKIELGELQRELDDAKREIERQKSLFKKAVDECERVTASATHAQAEIKSFQTDRQQLKQRAQAAENQVAELAAALAAATHETKALQQQIDQDLSLSQARLEATETQLTVRERELAEVQDENSQILQSLAGAQSEVASMGIDLTRLEQELSFARQSLEHAAGTEESLLQAKQELEFKLGLAISKTQRLEQEHEQLHEHAEVLRRDLAVTDAGQELIDLRGRLRDLTDDRAKIAETLAEKRTELKELAATEQGLRTELAETQGFRDEAERRAAANSELQLNKDNEVLRGIVARQNTTLGVYFTELRRLRRGRFALRIVYGLFGLALVALVGFAVTIFTHRGLGDLFKQLLH